MQLEILTLEILPHIFCLVIFVTRHTTHFKNINGTKETHITYSHKAKGWAHCSLHRY